MKTFTTRDWVYIAVFGALWGAIEISLGAYLHVIFPPLADTFLVGVIMAGLGGIIALTGRHFVPYTGSVLMIGVVTTLLKALSLGGVKIGPMVAILAESLLMEAGLLLAQPRMRRKTRMGFALAGALAVSWNFIHKFVMMRLLFGKGVSEVAVKMVKEGNKHYVVRRQSEQGAQMGYEASLPLEIPAADPSKRYSIPFYIADDIEGGTDRIRQVQLRLNISNIVSEDRLTVLLNGESLTQETCLRDYGNPFGPYSAQWLEFHLKKVRPRKGQNILEISLDSRPEGIGVGIKVEEMEVYVEYGSYPSALNWSSRP